MRPPQRVERLEPKSLPVGEVSRLVVEIVHDALGFPVLLPVLVARGERPGPTFGITAAVHGNELNGIPVVHQLFERLDIKNLRGTLVGVVAANVLGLGRMERGYVDGTDLNDIMPGRPDGNASGVYAHRFIDRVVRGFDYLVDLHTASFGRVNSLYVRAEMTHGATAEMAYLQRPQIILHNPPSDGTLRGAADELDIPAITVEIGNPHQFQPNFIKRALVGLRAVLGEVGMLPRRNLAMSGPVPILCDKSRWLYADHGGLLEVFPEVTQRVGEGEVVARLRDAFGDVLREYKAPFDGGVIGKSNNPAGVSGARIIHLGHVVDASHPFATYEHAAASLRGSVAGKLAR